MKLVLYSGGYWRENIQVDNELFRQFRGKSNLLATFIPAESYHGHADFRSFVRYFSKRGISRFLYCPIDRKLDNVLLSEVLKSDFIHIHGGNTFALMDSIRSKKLAPRFKEYLNDGGVMTGLSAGAIVMTPTIDTATFPKHDCDDNEVGLKSFLGMKFTPFHFFPHYKSSERYDKDLIRFSKKIGQSKVYAAKDGSGLIIEDEKIHLIGKVYCFFQGKKVPLT